MIVAVNKGFECRFPYRAESGIVKIAHLKADTIKEMMGLIDQVG